ncbi:unnamed protein product [Phaedon cochleariae]|uniref:Uncharacterized protein n=1 Tax=Phaedon cochleariae TaxID=80249 RepID=A0A9N9SCP5_PHACE|nr:unnamed protein product [Phaedon cochleariae]
MVLPQDAVIPEGEQDYIDFKQENPEVNEFYNNLLKSLEVHDLVTITLNDLILATLMIVLHVSIILAFWKSDKLRGERLNLYILNLSCIDLTTHITRVITYVDRSIEEYFNLTLYCLEKSGMAICKLLYLIITLALALDWCVTCLRPNWTANVQKYWKYGIIALYLSVFIGLIERCRICFGPEYWNMRNIHLLKNLAFIMDFVLVLVVNILDRTFKMRATHIETSHVLKTVNIIIMSFVPLIVHTVLSYYFRPHLIVSVFLYYTIFLTEMINYSHFLLVAYCLWTQCEDFRLALSKLYKRTTGPSKLVNERVLYEGTSTNTYISADYFEDDEDQNLMSAVCETDGQLQNDHHVEIEFDNMFRTKL